MKLALDGSFLVSASPAESFVFLTDPGRFAPLLPMFKELKDISADSFTVLMDVGVPQIRGRAEVQVHFAERVLDERASFTSNVRHSLGVADATMGFSLLRSGTGTEVKWSCDSTVRGTLASVASGILSPLAKRNIRAMIDSVQNELGKIEPVADESEDEKETGLGGRVSAWFSNKKKVAT